MSVQISLNSATTFSDVGLWYDFNSAVYNASDIGSMILYEEGCRRGDGHDCAWACGDVEQVWTNMYTLHNCVLYPVIANLVYGKNITNQDYLTLAAQIFNIPSDAVEFLGWPVIERCVEDYCKQPDQGGCEGNGQGINMTYPYFNTTDNVTSYELYSITSFRADVCVGIDAEINPDIGGTGMFVSYIIQIGVVFISWAAWHFLEHWTWYFVYIYHLCRRQPSQGLEAAQAIQEALKESNVNHSLIHALGEFQKAQVFFMLAVQIACLIALQSPQYLNSASYQQFFNNIGILFDLALAGVLPILLSLLILRQAGNKDTQIMFISACCIAISTATWFTTWHFFPAAGSNPNLVQEIKSQGPVSCFNRAPTEFCYASNWFTSNTAASGQGIAMLIFGLTVLGCIMIDHTRVFRVAGNSNDKFNLFEVASEWIAKLKVWNKYEVLTRSSRLFSWLRSVQLETGRDVVTAVERLLVIVTELTLLLLTVTLLTDYGRLLAPTDYHPLNLSEWTLGQVISVTIWMPVIFEFIWDCHKGIAKTIEVRLGHHYIIVKKDRRASIENWPPSYPATKNIAPSESGVALTNFDWDSSYEPLREVGMEH